MPDADRLTLKVLCAKCRGAVTLCMTAWTEKAKPVLPEWAEKELAKAKK